MDQHLGLGAVRVNGSPDDFRVLIGGFLECFIVSMRSGFASEAIGRCPIESELRFHVVDLKVSAVRTAMAERCPA
jgi:hypothetical protein